MTDELKPTDPTALSLRVLEQIAQEGRRPDIPMVDGFGFNLVEYDCAKCARTGYVAEQVVAIYRARELRLHCLPCQSPERWKWRLEAETGRETLVPLQPGKKPATEQYGEREARELELRHYELTEARERQRFLRDALENTTTELVRVDARVAALEIELPELAGKVASIQSDPDRAKRQKLVEMRRQLANLEEDCAQLTEREQLKKRRRG